ncbi:hypothetical protein [Cetobacterium sp.]|uniref:hypothetical protein n=1 Tax=Cetobacterium sp. TaxID=2071632 RepID=UPI003F34ACEC
MVINKDNLAFVIDPDKTEEFLKEIDKNKGNLKKAIDRIEGKKKRSLNKKKSSSVVTEELFSPN